MADNYLEKKMEDLRAGRTVRPGYNHSAEERVVVAGFGCGVSALAEVVSRLRRVGKRVAFAGCDNKSGTELARSTGAQYHPADWIADTEALITSLRLVWRGWRGVDRVVIVCCESDVNNENLAITPDAFQIKMASAVEAVRRSQPVWSDGNTVFEVVVAEV